MKSYLALLGILVCVSVSAASVSDLTQDARFGSGSHGIETLDYTGASGDSTDRVVAILPKSATLNSGQWVIASHSNGGSDATWELFDLTASGTDHATDLSIDPFIGAPVDAVIADVSGQRRIFILGTVVGGSGTIDFGIKCINVTGGNFQGDCPNFGNLGRAALAVDFNQGSSHTDFAQRIAYYNSYLYATGFVDVGTTTTDFAVGVAKVSASDGTLADGWGNLSAANGLFVKNINYQANGTDVPYAIVVAPANPLQIDFRVDVFIAGASTVAANDVDGWLMAIDENLTSGAQLDPLWNNGGIRRYFFDLGTTHKQDQLSALTQRHNGNLLFAGYATDDDDTEMVVGEVTPNGTPLASFCGGGVCHSSYLSLLELPVGIVERPGAGNFVVAADSTADFFGDGHRVASVYQFHYNGVSIDAYNQVDLAAEDPRRDETHATTVILDPYSKDVLMGGWTLYTAAPPADSGDDDGFVTWYQADDSIFANGFGGAYRD